MAARTAASMPGSTPSKNHSRGTPSVSPRTPASRSRVKSSAGRAAHHSSSASGPAIAFSSSAASSTVRAIGPTVSNDHASGVTPRRLTRPSVGLSPTTPQAPAGMRIEPPVSVPSETAHRPAASAAPLPPLEPPGLRSRSQGLRQGP